MVILLLFITPRKPFSQTIFIQIFFYQLKSQILKNDLCNWFFSYESRMTRWFQLSVWSNFFPQGIYTNTHTYTYWCWYSTDAFEFMYCRHAYNSLSVALTVTPLQKYAMYATLTIWCYTAVGWKSGTDTFGGIRMPYGHMRQSLIDNKQRQNDHSNDTFHFVSFWVDFLI